MNDLFLLHNAYFLLIPLAIIEGPLVALLCGIAVAFGYLNPFIAWGILVGGDILPDLMYYWLGRWGATIGSVRTFATRTKLIRENLAQLEFLWREHFLPALVAAKLAYGVAPPLIVSVGLSKIPVWKFVGYSLLISSVYLGALMWLGFGLAQTFGDAGNIFGDAPAYFTIVGILCLCLFVGIAYLARRRLPLRGDLRTSVDGSASRGLSGSENIS